MRHMRVLIAFERSGVVRNAFRAAGHDAYSCDLAPAQDCSPYHAQEDAIAKIRRGPWDLVIAHPPCTRLANSGSLRLYRGGKKAGGIDPQKWEEMSQGAALFRSVFESYDGPLCVENPQQHGHAYLAHGMGKPTQTIQPYEFGEDASKATCLWLRGLPPLTPTRYILPRVVIDENGRIYPRWANQTDSGQNRLCPSPDRAQKRSQTYPGIARAMAEQWSKIL